MDKLLSDLTTGQREKIRINRIGAEEEDIRTGTEEIQESQGHPFKT